MLAGRDPHELLTLLEVTEADEVLCCTPDSPRALPAVELARVVTELGGRPRVVPSVGAAVQAAVAASEADDVVLVTGSLYTVGAARAACRTIRGLKVEG